MPQRKVAYAAPARRNMRAHSRALHWANVVRWSANVLALVVLGFALTGTVYEVTLDQPVLPVAGYIFAFLIWLAGRGAQALIWHSA